MPEETRQELEQRLQTIKAQIADLSTQVRGAREQEQYPGSWAARGGQFLSHIGNTVMDLFKGVRRYAPGPVGEALRLIPDESINAIHEPSQQAERQLRGEAKPIEPPLFKGTPGHPISPALEQYDLQQRLKQREEHNLGDYATEMLAEAPLIPLRPVAKAPTILKAVKEALKTVAPPVAGYEAVKSAGQGDTLTESAMKAGLTVPFSLLFGTPASRWLGVTPEPKLKFKGDLPPGEVGAPPKGPAQQLNEFMGPLMDEPPRATVPQMEPIPEGLPKPAALTDKPVAPVTFVGTQKGWGGHPDFDLWNLTEDIPGHPSGSTLSSKTLEDLNYSLPPIEEPPKLGMAESMQAPPAAENVAEAGQRYWPITTPRPTPDWLSGTPESIHDITRSLIDVAQTAIRQGAKFKPNVLGYYRFSDAGIRIRHASDLQTKVHEVGHALDDRFGILRGEDHLPLGQGAYDSELAHFWPHTGSSSPMASAEVNRTEGLAEWMVSRMLNKDATTALSPKFTQHFESKVDPATLQAMDVASAKIRTLRTAMRDDPLAAIGSQMERLQQTSWSWKQLFERPMTGIGLSPMEKYVNQMVRSDNAVVNLLKEWRTILKPNSPLDPLKDVPLLTQVYRGGHSGRVEAMMEQGIPRVHGKNEIRPGTEGGINGALNQLAGISKNYTEFSEHLHRALSWMLAQRSLEKAEQGITAFRPGSGMVSDQWLATKASDISYLPPPIQEAYQNFAKRYRAIASGILENMVEYGSLSPKAFKEIKSKNLFYVAMHRIMELQPGEPIVPRGGWEGFSPKLKKLEGSSKMIKQSLRDLIQQFVKHEKDGQINELKALLTSEDWFGGDFRRPAWGGSRGQQPPVPFAKVLTAVEPGEANTWKVYRRGKEENWQVSSELVTLFEDLFKHKEVSAMWNAIRMFTGFKRDFITYNPIFATKNWLRDAFERGMLSRTGSTPWESIGPAFTNLRQHHQLADPKDVEMLKRSFGAYAGFYAKNDRQYNRLLINSMKRMMADDRFIMVSGTKLKHAYMNFTESSEHVGRIAEYKSAYKLATTKGVDLGDGQLTKLNPDQAHLWAIFQARDLLDFSVAGSAIRAMNDWSAFTSARTRGMFKIFERASEGDVGAQSYLFLKYAVLPTAISYGYIDAMGLREEYMRIDPKIRYTYTLFPVPTGLTSHKWMALPKPFEHGALAGLLESAFESARTGSMEPMDQSVKNLFDAFSPIDLQSLMGPTGHLIEGPANIDLWRMKHVVPSYEEGRDLDTQIRKASRRGPAQTRGGEALLQSSELAGAVQKAIGVDARYVDHYLASIGGYAGRYAQQVSNVFSPEKPQQLGLQSLGLEVKPSPVRQRDVVWVKEMAQRKRLEKDRDYQHLNRTIDAYYKAKDSETKAELTKQLGDQAFALRRKWEEQY